MNDIPEDNELEELENKLRKIFETTPTNEWHWYDAGGNEIFPAESELERLDEKYALLFEAIERGNSPRLE